MLVKQHSLSTLKPDKRTNINQLRNVYYFIGITAVHARDSQYNRLIVATDSFKTQSSQLVSCRDRD